MNYRKQKFAIIIFIINLVLVFSGCNVIENNKGDLQQPSQKSFSESDSEKLSNSDNKTVSFSTFDINKKYFNDIKGFVELRLKLPRLKGNYDGIPKINKYFIDKEKFFYDELPLDVLKEANIKVQGEADNWYRSADYKLESVLGNIISMSAYLNGGAGGVGWAGIEGDTFNLNTGEKLELGDVFKVDEYEYMNFIYEFVSKEIMTKINSNKELGYGSGYNFDDAYSGVGFESIRGVDPNNFYLTENALVIFYPKYDLACGAAGPQVFSISFELISNMLDIEVK
ncbi:RsiV family protein [Sporosalibacterium faouarense]|uniref:RsiV family protein n=1 Tax=Sporosalibacterium faouarense TaxID=516123 RepID=UPI00192CCDDE|nr:RsiV family protein [Sporosalibacterium faouarense]